MYPKRVLLLNDQPIGTFTLDEKLRMTFDITQGGSNIVELLDYATDNGMSVIIAQHPEYESED